MSRLRPWACCEQSKLRSERVKPVGSGQGAAEKPTAGRGKPKQQLKENWLPQNEVDWELETSRLKL